MESFSWGKNNFPRRYKNIPERLKEFSVIYIKKKSRHDFRFSRRDSILCLQYDGLIQINNFDLKVISLILVVGKQSGFNKTACCVTLLN